MLPRAYVLAIKELPRPSRLLLTTACDVVGTLSAAACGEGLEEGADVEEKIKWSLDNAGLDRWAIAALLTALCCQSLKGIAGCGGGERSSRESGIVVLHCLLSSSQEQLKGLFLPISSARGSDKADHQAAAGDEMLRKLSEALPKREVGMVFCPATAPSFSTTISSSPSLFTASVPAMTSTHIPSSPLSSLALCHCALWLYDVEAVSEWVRSRALQRFAATKVYYQSSLFTQPQAFFQISLHYPFFFDG